MSQLHGTLPLDVIGCSAILLIENLLVPLQRGVQSFLQRVGLSHFTTFDLCNAEVLVPEIRAGEWRLSPSFRFELQDLRCVVSKKIHCTFMQDVWFPKHWNCSPVLPCNSNAWDNSNV